MWDSCETLRGRKGVKGLFLVGHEKVPSGFGIRPGDCGGDTADGSGNRGRPFQPSMDYWAEPGVYLSYGLLFLFPEMWYPSLA